MHGSAGTKKREFELYSNATKHDLPGKMNLDICGSKKALAALKESMISLRICLKQKRSALNGKVGRGIDLPRSIPAVGQEQLAPSTAILVLGSLTNLSITDSERR